MTKRNALHIIACLVFPTMPCFAPCSLPRSSDDIPKWQIDERMWKYSDNCLPITGEHLLFSIQNQHYINSPIYSSPRTYLPCWVKGKVPLSAQEESWVHLSLYTWRKEREESCFKNNISNEQILATLQTACTWYYAHSVNPTIFSRINLTQIYPWVSKHYWTQQDGLVKVRLGFHSNNLWRRLPSTLDLTRIYNICLQYMFYVSV